MQFWAFRLGASAQVPLHALRRPGKQQTAPGLLGYLQQIPPARVEKLRRNVLAARGKLQYAEDEGTPGGDALSTIVDRLHAQAAQRPTRENVDPGRAAFSVCSPVFGTTRTPWKL